MNKYFAKLKTGWLNNAITILTLDHNLKCKSPGRDNLFTWSLILKGEDNRFYETGRWRQTQLERAISSRICSPNEAISVSTETNLRTMLIISPTHTRTHSHTRQTAFRPCLTFTCLQRPWLWHHFFSLVFFSFLRLKMHEANALSCKLSQKMTSERLSGC